MLSSHLHDACRTPSCPGFSNSRPPKNDNRFRPGVHALEARDVPSTVTVERLSDAVEGGSAGVFRLTRTGDPVGELVVNIAVGGTADDVADYYIFDATRALFATGSAHTDVVIQAHADGPYDPDETVTVTLQSGTGYTVGTQHAATLYITDTSPPVVTAARVNDAAEGGTDGVVRFTRTGDTSGALSVTYEMYSTATPGVDWVIPGSPGVAYFAPGAATAEVLVQAAHDGELEETETLFLALVEGSGYTIGTESSAAVDLIDTDILPVAFDGVAVTSVNQSVTITVLDLATSLYGDTLTVTGVTSGASGSVVLNADGTVTYTPATGFSGDDAFTYTVSDPFGNTSTGTVRVTVTRPAAPPVSVWTAVDTAVTIDVPTLAFDPDGQALTTVAVTQGGNGTAAVNADGTVTYTPNTGFTGQDSFDYTVQDPDGNQATHTITVTVGPTDPIAQSDAVVTPVDTALNVAVLDLAFQPAGGSLAVTAVTQGNYGSVAINPDGSVTYTPNPATRGPTSSPTPSPTGPRGPAPAPSPSPSGPWPRAPPTNWSPP